MKGRVWMVVSLFIAASFLFQVPTFPVPAAIQPCCHRHHHCPPSPDCPPSPGAAITAIKGNIQFALVVPSPLPRQDIPPRLLPPMTAAAVPWDSPAQEEREEQELIAAINAARAERGLETLQTDPLLTQTARAHSREMWKLDYFDHVSPTTGQTMPMDRYLKALRGDGQDQPDQALVGENLFYCSITSSAYNVGYAHQALMGSPGHRANILEPRFTKIGVGLCRDSQGRFWVTEMFLRDTAASF